LAWKENRFEPRRERGAPELTEKGTVGKHQFVPFKSPRAIETKKVKDGVQARLGECKRGCVRERDVKTSTELRHRLRGVGAAVSPEALIHLVKPLN
jgi:hypothetical protein